MTEAFKTMEFRYGRIGYFSHDVGALTRSLQTYGEWAENELAFLATLAPLGGTVFDIGAYIGTHALAFSRFVGAEGVVIAVEPQKASYEQLRHNVALNELLNIRAIHAAAGASSGQIAIDSIDIGVDSSFGSASLIFPPQRQSRIQQVTLLSLDSLQPSACDLIKIDAEGMESAVIHGARTTITRFQPFVYAEVNSLEAALQIRAELTELNYELKMHVVNAFNPNNFFGEKKNIFGLARENAILGFSPRAKGVLANGLSRRDCERLIDINTADDIVFGMLCKPQYKGEVLDRSIASQDAPWLSASLLEMVSADVNQKIDQVQNALSDVQSLAISRQETISLLEQRLDRTEAALESTQMLAVERYEIINKLQADLRALREIHEVTSASLSETRDKLNRTIQMRGKRFVRRLLRKWISSSDV